MELHTISEKTLFMNFSFRATAHCVPPLEVISTLNLHQIQKQCRLDN